MVKKEQIERSMAFVLQIRNRIRARYPHLSTEDINIILDDIPEYNISNIDDIFRVIPDIARREYIRL